MTDFERDTSRAWVEVDLSAIEHNVRELKKLLKPNVKMMGVVKADAYGHGVAETAKSVLDGGAEQLAVAFADEAIQLRQYGFDVPILILGETPRCRFEDLLNYDIMPCVFDETDAVELSRVAQSMGKTAKLHIKIDTGMSRLGFVYNDDDKTKNATFESIMKIAQLPNLEMVGMFTHFASADEEDETYTYMQFKRFMELSDRLAAAGVKIPLRHVCNSAGIIQFPEMQLEMVRAGVAMYGMYPSECVDKERAKLIPAMTFKARVVNLNEFESGVCISYGRTYKTDVPSKIATISAGYADGYSRMLSGKAVVMAGGKKVKQTGRICMDQCMIDVSDVNNINVGDEVILFGGGEQDGIPVELIAGMMGTINYELVCMVGKRVPRIYIREGKAVCGLNHTLRSQYTAETE